MSRTIATGQTREVSWASRLCRHSSVSVTWLNVKTCRPSTSISGGFTGERFLEKVAPALSPPEMLVEGLHVFTFNQVTETEEWRQSLLAQLTSRV